MASSQTPQGPFLNHGNQTHSVRCDSFFPPGNHRNLRWTVDPWLCGGDEVDHRHLIEKLLRTVIDLKPQDMRQKRAEKGRYRRQAEKASVRSSSLASMNSWICLLKRGRSELCFIRFLSDPSLSPCDWPPIKSQPPILLFSAPMMHPSGKYPQHRAQRQGGPGKQPTHNHFETELTSSNKARFPILTH